MVAESWFRSLWRTPRKHDSGTENTILGVLAFEIASLMAKLVHQWQSLSDKQVVKLREEISNSTGIKKLISDDDDFIVGLVCVEMIDNLCHVARSVARIGKKCEEPSLKSFEHVFEDLVKTGVSPSGSVYTWKKMDKKIKKMERFIMLDAKLYQEMGMLADLEQGLRRMKGSEDSDAAALVELQKKIVWKKQELKSLRDVSLWNKSYDYTVRLLARSLYTIFMRIKHVFGINQMVDVVGEVEASGVVGDMDSDFIYRSQSVSVLMQSSVHPSEGNIGNKSASGPLGRFSTQSGPLTRSSKPTNFYSGPLSGTKGSKAVPVSGQSKGVTFYSGPLGKSAAKSGTKKANQRIWKSRDFSSIFWGKNPHSKHNLMAPTSPINGFLMGGNGSSPVRNGYMISNGVSSSVLDQNPDTDSSFIRENILHSNLSVFSFKKKLLKPIPGTLGAAALSLHYANVIIVIEKLVASPQLIGHDARDDLYNMLPASVRSSLRATLKPYAKTLASSMYDTALAGEWSHAMASILEWLAPLAHNMIRWQSERSFEQQNLVSRTNVLLVQTLFFANQKKTEEMITELLVGLNYIWRLGRDLNVKASLECASSRVFDEYIDIEG